MVPRCLSSAIPECAALAIPMRRRPWHRCCCSPSFYPAVCLLGVSAFARDARMREKGRRRVFILMCDRWRVHVNERAPRGGKTRLTSPDDSSRCCCCCCRRRSFFLLCLPLRISLLLSLLLLLFPPLYLLPTLRCCCLGRGWAGGLFMPVQRTQQACS